MAISKGLTFRQQLLAIGSVAVVALLVVFGIAVVQHRQTGIGGTVYRQLAMDSELTADILPPPLFVVETMLHVEELANPDGQAMFDNALNEVREHQLEYQQRVARWADVALPPDVRRTLDQGHATVEQLYRLVSEQLIPAIKAGDATAADEAHHQARMLFERHRGEIATLVEQVNISVKEHEATAQATASFYLMLLIVVGLIAVALTALLAWRISQRVTGALGAEPAELASIAQAVAKGDLSRQLPATIAEGSVLASMAAMLSKLREGQAQAITNLRILGALDNTSTNLMIADADRTIIYMNKSVEKMLRGVEADMRKALPQFSVDKIVGTNMDSFHRNPAHQANLLANLQQQYVSQITVAGNTFRLTASPVFAPDGKRLGTVVEWLDRTAEVKVEAEVADVVNRAGAGDFTQRLTLAGKEGFFKTLAEGLNSLMETTASGLSDIATVLGALAKGDLTARITKDYQGTFGELKQYANDTTEALTGMMAQIREAADTIHTAASEIAAGNADLSSRTEQQASSLEETASSMEELTSTVRQNADNARQASGLANNASQVASSGGAVVSDVVVTMASINASARKISDIISVIDGIAFQTNILALNAAVEAARAGEQGRGFAVVAGEVRTLAQRSAAAAKEIKALISDSVEKVDAGNALVSKAGSTMNEIVVAIKRVTDIMAEIAAASAEQSTGIEEVNAAVTQMDEMTQQNAALVEEAAASAESLQSQANLLAQSVAAFRFDHSGGGSPLLAAPVVHPGGHGGRPLAAPKPVTKGPAKGNLPAKPVRKPAARPAEDEWEEF